MSLPQDITPALRDWLHEPDGLPPPRIVELAPLVHQTPQQRGVLPPLSRRFRTMFQATTWVAAGLVVALFGGLLISGALTPREDRSVLPGATESAAPSVVVPTPVATGTPVPIDPSAQDIRFELVSGDGPQLEWTKIEPGSVRADSGWEATWQGTTVRATDGEYGPLSSGRRSFTPIEIVVTRPDGNETRSTIDRHGWIRSLAFGPKGIVLTSESAFDADEAAALVAADQLQGDRTTSFNERTRVVRIERPGEEPVRIKDPEFDTKLAEIGLHIRDYEGYSYAWLSTDGETWQPIDRLTAPDTDLVSATRDGFVAVVNEDDRSALWYSPDGLDWRALDRDARGGLLQWNGETIVHDGRFIGLVSGSGVEDLPLTDAVFGRDGAFRRAQGSGAGVSGTRWWHAASELGIVSLDFGKDLLMYSPDGERWSLTRLPDDWSPCGQCGRRNVLMMDSALVAVAVWAGEGETSKVEQWVGRLPAAGSVTARAEPAAEDAR